LGKLPSSALYGGVTLGTTIGVTGDGDFLHTSLCDFQCVLWQAEPQYLVPQQPQLNLAPIDEQKAHDASNDILLRFVKCVGVWGLFLLLTFSNLGVDFDGKEGEKKKPSKRSNSCTSS
jgi:hypothetical protein